MQTVPLYHPLFHSDTEVSNTPTELLYNKLKHSKKRQSISSIAKCIDNGPVEGFWGIIKREMYYGKCFTLREELIQSILDYIEYYNNRRLQRKYGIGIGLNVAFKMSILYDLIQALILEVDRILWFLQISRTLPLLDR